VRLSAVSAVCNTRLIVVVEMLNRCATWLIELLPVPIMRIISALCEAPSFGGRSICRPALRAIANPCRVCSRIISLSSSANAQCICIMSRPGTVVVPIASRRERNRAPACSISASTNSRLRSERDSRSCFHTTRTSPALRSASTRFSSERSESAPHASYLYNFWQFAAISISRCPVSSW
jgi:hypothetical protein